MSIMPKEMEMRKKKSVGFTLIELLIVVAIIGILAAIAVPNFLEAQVRAKVARSQADMRTMATGLEVYYVDYNMYPKPEQGADPASYLIPLTTPVAFLAELPKYEWAPWQNWVEDPPGSFNYVVEDVYYYRYDTKAYWDENFEKVGTTNTYTGDLWTSETVMSWKMFDPDERKMWCLSAVGPDGKPNTQAFDSTDPNNWGICTIEYDATNGSVSYGDIIRMGP